MTKQTQNVEATPVPSIGGAGAPEAIVTMTRSQFVDLVATALVEAVESSSALTRLHQSVARYIASDTFDRALRAEDLNS